MHSAMYPYLPSKLARGTRPIRFITEERDMEARGPRIRSVLVYSLTL